MNKFNAVTTRRVHALETKEICIQVMAQGQIVGRVPFDTELPELEAHLAAAQSLVDWWGKPGHEIIGYVELEPTQYAFLLPVTADAV